MLYSNSYEYNFEIETILQQFIAIIDNAIVMRYSVNKESGNRELDEIIKPGYILGTKQRVMLDIVNKAKNYELPVVIVSIGSISFNKERQAAKNIPITVSSSQGDTQYARPTPISIKVDLTIMTKYMTDLYQIYGKLATQFQPAMTYSWFVPQNINHNWSELRNKIVWDGELGLDIRTESKSSDEDKFTGKLSFTIDGWLFPTMNTCNDTIIYNIGTSIVPNEDTLSRIHDEISLFRPLAYSVLKGEEWDKYNNPRQLGTVHPSITSIYFTYNINRTPAHFILDKERSEKYNINSKSEITISGYNLNDSSVLLISENPIKNLTVKTVSYNNFLLPFPDTKEEKERSIAGYPLNIVKQSNNQITVNFENIPNIPEEFDIAVLNDFDYDLLSKRKGFKLRA